MALRVESIEKVMAYWSRNLATTFHERGVHDPNLDLDGVRHVLVGPAAGPVQILDQCSLVDPQV